ncbi:MAG: class I SAM-dependent methyltransferase [Atopobiaceae bacterium]|nr:class I SAM-dependent methyltransferase [Atopobiaceae bacterium]
MTKLHIEKNTVQETLVIPLYGRKLACEMFPGLIGDTKAAELMDAIDYDFASVRRLPAFGVLEGAMRSYDLVAEIKTYLTSHPRAAVVNMGCGLDTLFTQADNGTTRGINLDMPDVIAVREQLLPSSERERNVACDLNDTSWFDEIGFDPAEGAVFVAAGVFYYFTNEQVATLVSAMAEAFPGGRLAFDATRKLGLKMMLATYVKDAGITDVGAFFHVEDPQAIRGWSPAISRVEPRGYLTGYHPWDKSWGAFNHLLARFGDATGLTRMIGIDFAR